MKSCGITLRLSSQENIQISLIRFWKSLILNYSLFCQGPNKLKIYNTVFLIIYQQYHCYWSLSECDFAYSWKTEFKPRYCTVWLRASYAGVIHHDSRRLHTGVSGASRIRLSNMSRQSDNISHFSSNSNSNSKSFYCYMKHQKHTKTNCIIQHNRVWYFTPSSAAKQ